MSWSGSLPGPGGCCTVKAGTVTVAGMLLVVKSSGAEPVPSLSGNERVSEDHLGAKRTCKRDPPQLLRYGERPSRDRSPTRRPRTWLPWMITARFDGLGVMACPSDRSHGSSDIPEAPSGMP